jgi:hypothetical protein
VQEIPSTSCSSAATPSWPRSSASSSACARASATRSATSTQQGRRAALGEVQQVERGKMVIMLNKSRDAEAIIPWKEQNPRERFRQGEPIRAVLKRVEETPKGPRLILSRAAPEFVAALFKLEVPEIYQGIVEIKGIAREVGGRTKVAVSSRDDSIDPVGACVGLKGSRVQAVVSELGGERIDIVPWHPDPEIYARARWRRPRSRRSSATRPARHHRHRRRGPAVARHRPQRPERAAREPAHRLADRPVRQPRVARARRGRRAVRRRRAGIRARRLPAARAGSAARHTGGSGDGRIY